MITSCNHSENIICGSCLMKNHQEKQVAENLLRGELLRRTLPYLEASLPGEMPDEVWEALRSDRATMETVLRGIVQTTKQNIKGRIERVAQGRGQ